VVWYRTDPRLAAINLITSGNPPRTYTLVVQTLDLFDIVHASILYVGYICLGGSLLTALVAWLRPY